MEYKPVIAVEVSDSEESIPIVPAVSNPAPHYSLGNVSWTAICLVVSLLIFVIVILIKLYLE